MRRKRCSLPAVDEPKLDVSSLVDVSFLLLIFFLVTATIMKKEKELTTRLPVNGTVLPSPPVVLVTVGGDGRVTWGRNEEVEVMSDRAGDHELPRLAERIKIIQSISVQKIPFQLQVSDVASNQRFTDVLNCFAKNGVDHIQVIDPPSL